MDIDSEKRFWLDGIEVDPQGSLISGPSGPQTVEPKVMSVLCLLASQPGETISRDQFMDQVWAVSFGSDESLTRAVSILRKVLGDQNGRRAMIETVPRKGYRLTASVSANPPPGEKSTVPKAQTPVVESPTKVWRNRKFGLVTTALLAPLLVIALAVGWAVKTSTHEGTSVQANSIRIDPFTQSGFSDGVTGPAQQFTANMVEIFSDSGIATRSEVSADGRSAEFALSGHLSPNGMGSLKAQLAIEHVESGLVLWSETLDQPATATAPDDTRFAAPAASVLNCVLGWRNPDYASEPETLQNYARYCDAYLFDRTRDVTIYSRLILRAEPDNPHAMAIHARALRGWAIFNRQSRTIDFQAVREEATALIDRALELDHDGRLVPAVWGVIRQQDVEPAAVETALAHAITTPGLPSEIYVNYNDILRRVGRNKDAERTVQNILDTSPHDARWHARAAWLAFVNGDKLKSERLFSKAETIDPDNAELTGRRRQVSLWYGGKSEVEKVLADWPDVETADTTQSNKCLKRFARARLAGETRAADVLESCASFEPPWRARMAASLGDVDAAYDELVGFDWTKFSSQHVLLFYPDMKAFRADPRFEALADKIGLREYWVRTGRLPDMCFAPDEPPICDSLRNASRKRQ